MTKLFFAVAMATLIFTSCDDDTKSYSINTTGNITLAATRGASDNVTVYSSQSWQASADANWLYVSQSYGNSGESRLTVSARTANTDYEPRSAKITFVSGNAADTVTVTQEAAAYVRTTQSTYVVSNAGASLNIEFSTNIDASNLDVYLSHEWLDQSANKAETDYILSLEIGEYEGFMPRIGYVYFVNNAMGIRPMYTITIIQLAEGSSSGIYSSTDFSADGTVRTIQQASAGNGLPIVIMGDGFVDTEVADGTYDNVMDKAIDNFFSEEPIKSLYEYFDIYAVTAVSENGYFGNGYKTALGCSLEGGGSTGISGDDDTIIEYAKKVDGLDIDQALVIVILNSSTYAGTTYFRYVSDVTSEVSEFAIAYCPVIDSLASEQFRQVLSHEAVGHGFAKLYDEYSYSGNGSISSMEITETREDQARGWAQNVDFTDDETAVIWADFIADDRYAAEGIGIFEGACTYARGAYRPTEESMMNSNTTAFNAPSRRSIYDHVMRRGAGIEADYEDFVQFDLLHKPETSALKSASPAAVPFAAPRRTGKVVR